MSIESFRKEFERLGHTVYIFAPAWKGYVDDNPHAGPARVFRYPALDFEFKFRFPLPIPYSWAIARKLRELKIDIIHSQHPNLLGSAARRWARKKKVPLVFTWHTLYDHYVHFAPPFIPTKLATWWTIRNARRYANRADAVVVPTDSIIGILRQWGVTQKITAIPTGIEVGKFADPDGKKVRTKYGVAEDEILLVLISRLTREKNVDFVLRSARRILQENPQVKFLLGGEGYLLPELKKLVAENGLEKKVIFAGLVEEVEIKNYLAAGDIFVHASQSETQGMIISEAMYAGLPIVAVRATGVSSLVMDKVNGYLVADKEAEFGQAVAVLAADKNLRNRMGEESRKSAQKYTSEVCAQKMLELYRQTIEKYKK